MTSKPNLEIGYGTAQGGEALEVGAEAARRALQQIREHPLSVVLVFASVYYNPEKLLRGIRRLTGDAPLVGTTTAGEICNNRQEESVVVVALASPHLRVKVGVGQGVSQNWQWALLEAVTAPGVAAYFGSPDDPIWSVSAQEGKSAFAFLFTPGALPPGGSYGFDILATLQRLTQGRLPIMGAGTPGAGPAAGNVVFWGPRVSSDSILIAIFETRLKFGLSLAHGFRPTDQRLVVTRSLNGEVLELDDQPAAEVYRRILGLPHDAPAAAARHPLGLAEAFGQYSLHRATAFTAGGGVRFSQPVPEGASLTLMTADPDNLAAAGAEALRKALCRGSIIDPGAVVVFSSALRSRLLGARAGEELSRMINLAPQTPMLGFSSFGEQGLGDDGVSRHHHEAVAVLALGRELSYAAEVALANRNLRRVVARPQIVKRLMEKLKLEVVQRRKIEEKLSKTEQLFNFFMKHLPGAATILDLQGRYVYVNEGWERLSQITREEALGKTAADIWPAEIAARFQETDELVLASKQSSQSLIALSQGDKKHNWLVNRFPILDGQGNLILLGAIGIDVTAQKHLIDSLQETTDTLAALIKASPLAIIALDVEKRGTLWNPAAERTFGWCAEEVLGDPNPTIPEELQEEYQEVVDRALHGKSFTQLEVHRQRKDGSLIDIVLSVAPLRDARGHLVGTAGLLADVSEQKKTEASLQALIHASPLAIYVLDRDGRVQMWNPASERFYGWTAGEALGQLIPCVPPDKLEQFYQYHRRVLNSESLAGVEIKGRRKDGTSLDIGLYAAPVCDSQGRVASVMMLNADVTERKRAREALKKSEATLKTIFKAAPIGIALVHQGLFWWENKQFTKMTGYAGSDLIGKSSRLLYDTEEEFKQVQQQQYGEMVRRGRGTMESRWKTKDGRLIDVLLSSAPVHPENPTEEVILTALNITARKQAAEAFKSLVYNAPIGIFITQGGKFKLVNPGFLKLTGYTEAELLGEDAFRYVPDEFREMVRTHAVQMLKGLRSAPFEYQYVTKGGETRWLVESVTPIQYEGERATLGFFLDVTEQALLEQQLRQSQKMEAVGRLAGGVAHDFNNMLTAIIWYSEMVMMACREDDPIYLQLEVIKKSAERASTLTRQLLAFSRKQLLQPRVTNLNTVITDLERMLRRLIGEDIHLLLELDPNLGAVKTDPGQIEQVIMNLVINARDAMPMGGKLTIQTANVYLDEAYSRRHGDLFPGPYAQIAVIDEGLGIDPETLAHVFEPFFTTKEANKGTGLGLFTVYGIVKQSGGHIEVASKVGEGTVFKIYLRQLQETMEESPGKAAVAAPLQGSETVLVVEDEEILLELIKEALEMHGYLVMAAHNSEEAIELCQQHREPIDLMLTDVVMPQQNGRDLAEFLAPLHPEMKTLYMSGYTEDAMVVRSLLEAALPFIQKPFPPLDLVRKVREMIDSRGN